MRAALVVSIACSAAYFYAVAGGSFPGHWLVKAASIASLAFLVRPYPLIVAALLFGSVGDALLSLGSGYFVYGLAAFLCGHIAYTFGFLKGAPPDRRFQPLPILALGCYAAGIYVVLQPSLGSLSVPVLFYMVAITAMAVASLRLGGWVSIGAALFLISDSILAVNRFHSPIPMSGYIVWSTYYVGQLLIALGCLKNAKPQALEGGL